MGVFDTETGSDQNSSAKGLSRSKATLQCLKTKVSKAERLSKRSMLLDRMSELPSKISNSMRIHGHKANSTHGLEGVGMPSTIPYMTDPAKMAPSHTTQKQVSPWGTSPAASWGSGDTDRQNLFPDKQSLFSDPELVAALSRLGDVTASTDSPLVMRRGITTSVTIANRASRAILTGLPAGPASRSIATLPPSPGPLLSTSLPQPTKQYFTDKTKPSASCHQTAPSPSYQKTTPSTSYQAPNFQSGSLPQLENPSWVVSGSSPKSLNQTMDMLHHRLSLPSLSKQTGLTPMRELHGEWPLDLLELIEAQREQFLGPVVAAQGDQTSDVPCASAPFHSVATDSFWVKRVGEGDRCSVVGVGQAGVMPLLPEGFADTRHQQLLSPPSSQQPHHHHILSPISQLYIQESFMLPSAPVSWDPTPDRFNCTPFTLALDPSGWVGTSKCMSAVEEQILICKQFISISPAGALYKGQLGSSMREVIVLATLAALKAGSDTVEGMGHFRAESDSARLDVAHPNILSPVYAHLDPVTGWGCIIKDSVEFGSLSDFAKLEHSSSTASMVEQAILNRLASSWGLTLFSLVDRLAISKVTYPSGHEVAPHTKRRYIALLSLLKDISLAMDYVHSKTIPGASMRAEKSTVMIGADGAARVPVSPSSTGSSRGQVQRQSGSVSISDAVFDYLPNLDADSGTASTTIYSIDSGFGSGSCVDVGSLGSCIWETISCVEADTKGLDVASYGLCSLLSPKTQDLLQQCLLTEPTSRPTAAEVAGALDLELKCFF